jgi:hypothetical protein
MPRVLTAADRKSLIRLASSLPKGSPEKKAILAGLAKTKTGAWKSRPPAKAPSGYDWGYIDADFWGLYDSVGEVGGISLGHDGRYQVYLQGDNPHGPPRKSPEEAVQALFKVIGRRP